MNPVRKFSASSSNSSLLIVVCLWVSENESHDVATVWHPAVKFHAGAPLQGDVTEEVWMKIYRNGQSHLTWTPGSAPHTFLHNTLLPASDVNPFLPRDHEIMRTLLYAAFVFNTQPNNECVIFFDSMLPAGPKVRWQVWCVTQQRQHLVRLLTYAASSAFQTITMA